MSTVKDKNSQSRDQAGSRGNPKLVNPARIYAGDHEIRCLDPTQLAKLEDAFRTWSRESSRPDVQASRKRILMIFLLIRYTGARLNEVLALDPHRDIDASKCVVRYGRAKGAEEMSRREVQISSELMVEIRGLLKNSALATQTGALLGVDAAHVRRKFYERSVSCGFDQDLGSPNAVRKARAVELMRDNMPLPVVQRILGHSTPNLTASLVAFSDEDIHQVTRHFIERESRGKPALAILFSERSATSRRVTFNHEWNWLPSGGDIVSTVITNTSLTRMGLKTGSLVTAEVKAPWVVLLKSEAEPLCTAENVFSGTVAQILRGKLTTEFVVRIHDGTELCSVVTEQSRSRLGLNEKDDVWVMFNSFAVILHVD